MNIKTIFVTLLLLITPYCYAQESVQSSNSFTAKNANELFLGGILKAESINSDAHHFLNVRLNPITISFSIPIKSKEIAPSHENMMKAIRDGLQESNPIKPNDTFSYIVRELKSYEELSLLFGQSIDPSIFFGTSANQKPKKSMAAIDISQSYFRVDMDLPESLSDDPRVDELLPELIYVNSIQFGRKAIIIIESNSSFQEVNSAVQNIMANTGKNALQSSENSKSVLSNSNIRCLILNDNGMENINPDNPLGSIIDYMNKSVTADDFGGPISFTASYLKDNGMFTNKFSIK